jgi:hypothetical protein
VSVLRIGRAVEVRGKRLHKNCNEVAGAEEDVFLEGLQMLEEFEFVRHEIDQAGHGGFVCLAN